MKNIIVCFSLFCSLFIFSQENYFWKNVKYGSDFSASFGSNNNAFSISPTVAYKFTEEFHLGFGGTYSYSKKGPYSANAFGPRALILYFPIKFIEFSANLTQLYVTQKVNNITNKYNYPSLKIGGAYKSGAFSFGIQCDVLHKKEKSFNPSLFSPFLRVLF